MRKDYDARTNTTTFYGGEQFGHYTWAEYKHDTGQLLYCVPDGDSKSIGLTITGYCPERGVITACDGGSLSYFQECIEKNIEALEPVSGDDDRWQHCDSRYDARDDLENVVYALDVPKSGTPEEIERAKQIDRTRKMIEKEIAVLDANAGVA